MKQILTLLFIFAYLFCSAQNKLGAIGSWRGHFDNHSVRNVIKGNYIYAATPYQIAMIDPKGVVGWLDKTTGLSDIDIINLVWDNNQNQLVIIYQNSNIDIVKGDQVFNLNAIQLSNLFSDKKINAVYVLQNLALLATNFGIVTIDLKKHEIKDTWFPNANQQPNIVYDITTAHDSIYAATENGIWVSPYILNGSQPNQWSHNTNLDPLKIKNFTQKNNTIYGYTSTSVFAFPNTKPFIQINNATIQHMDSTANNLLLNLQYATGKGAVMQLNKDYSTTILVDSMYLNAPLQTLLDNNDYWIADSSLGLLNKNSSAYQWTNLGGTIAAIHGTMSVSEDHLVAPFKNNKGYAVFSNSGWKNSTQIGNSNLPLLNASAINITDNSYWFSTDKNLLHITNNNSQAESIQPNNFIGAYKEIHTDQNNAIWAIQDQQGLVRQSNANWNSVAIPNNLSNTGLDKFIINKQQQAWIIAPNNQGLYIYQSKDVYATTMWKQLTTAPSNGNLPSTHVTSLVNDKLGSVWVGTDNGIGIFNCDDIANSPCNAYLPIVSNNGFNGYLFQKETVLCITVDGANRKWIGTNNGAWLLSEDGLNIIEHFSISNSPLTSDTVLQISIAPKSGEVFFNTNNGMVSYRGTATEAVSAQNNIQIFPNPVPPNFNGLVAFRGLVDNAIVKITDLTGKLLYQTAALGGQAVWNTRTIDGRKVATGIYLVFVRDISGNEKGVGKIVIADGY
jgi:hypothetical protein